MALDPLVQETQDHLFGLGVYLEEKYRLREGASLIVILDMVSTMLRGTAPLEFDAYLDVLREELANGRKADRQRLQDAREELLDILTLSAAG